MKFKTVAGIGLIALGIGAFLDLHFVQTDRVLAQAPRPAFQAFPAGPNGQEIEETLFVLKPDAAGNKTAVTVAWIPQPIQKYCIGKTHNECATLDYCIRTTNKNVAMCKNLSVDVTRFAYPADLRPRRMISVTLFAIVGMPGFDGLRKFVESAPQGTLDRYSLNARVKAKIKFTRTAQDDDFNLMEVLAGPPL